MTWVKGNPGDVMILSMNIVAEQRGQFIMPSIPASFEGGMKEYQQLNGFIRRAKTPDWVIQNAWTERVDLQTLDDRVRRR